MDTLLNMAFYVSLQTTLYCWKLFRADCHQYQLVWKGSADNNALPDIRWMVEEYVRYCFYQTHCAEVIWGHQRVNFWVSLRTKLGWCDTETLKIVKSQSRGISDILLLRYLLLVYYISLFDVTYFIPSPQPKYCEICNAKKVTVLLQMKKSLLHLLALIYDVACKIFYS